MQDRRKAKSTRERHEGVVCGDTAVARWGSDDSGPARRSESMLIRCLLDTLTATSYGFIYSVSLSEPFGSSSLRPTTTLRVILQSALISCSGESDGARKNLKLAALASCSYHRMYLSTSDIRPRFLFPFTVIPILLLSSSSPLLQQHPHQLTRLPHIEHIPRSQCNAEELRP